MVCPCCSNFVFFMHPLEGQYAFSFLGAAVALRRRSRHVARTPEFCLTTFGFNGPEPSKAMKPLHFAPPQLLQTCSLPGCRISKQEMGPEASGTVPTDHLAEAMAQVSKKLGLFERVRAVCHSESIPIPGVVVVGDQSSGKSSLLENISGIRFPRSQTTCTRMPCVLQLLSDPTVGEPFAEVSMDPSFADVPLLSDLRASFVPEA